MLFPVHTASHAVQKLAEALRAVVMIAVLVALLFARSAVATNFSGLDMQRSISQSECASPCEDGGCCEKASDCCQVKKSKFPPPLQPISDSGIRNSAELLAAVVPDLLPLIATWTPPAVESDPAPLRQALRPASVDVLAMSCIQLI